MKNINKFLILFALVLGFTACDNDEDKMYVLPADQVTAPVLAASSNEIVVTEATYNWSFLVLDWSRSNFGTDVLTQYSIELSDGTETIVESLGNNIYEKSFSGKELSTWAIEKFNGWDKVEKVPNRVNLTARIIASPALENPTVTNPVEQVYSNAITIAVTPHYVETVPKNIYMIGNDFGAWNWDDAGVVDMTPVNGNEGNFWCIRYFTAGQGFKWSTTKDWTGNDFFSLGYDIDEDGIGWYNEDGNAFVPTDGLYMVYINWNESKISIEPAKIYGMGDCFGSWDAGMYPFEIAGNLAKLTTVGAGELRIYANSNISVIGGDWWRMEFVPIAGVIEYRGNGEDQERVNVGAGQSVALDFNAGTATIN